MFYLSKHITFTAYTIISQKLTTHPQFPCNDIPHCVFACVVLIFSFCASNEIKSSLSFGRTQAGVLCSFLGEIENLMDEKGNDNNQRKLHFLVLNLGMVKNLNESKIVFQNSPLVVRSILDIIFQCLQRNRWVT